MISNALTAGYALPLRGVTFGGLIIILICATTGSSQPISYPKEIRGYKVERRVVELKKPAKQAKEREPGGARPRRVNDGPQNDGVQSAVSNPDSDEDTLIQLGRPQLARITPLGITFEVPIVVAPVKQSGNIHFLVFEDMVVNGTSVQIAEYHRAFDLPNKERLTLREPLTFYIYLPSVILATLGDWSDAKETWPVTGRVYVFGKFRKSIFSFKRCIPVELNLSMRNPLRER